MSVPGVLPAKMVVKMILSRGRNQTGKPKEETEKEMSWGRKMGCTPSGAPGPNLGEGKKKEMEQTETSQKVLFLRDALRHWERMS